jgi:hypothetical protein
MRKIIIAFALLSLLAVGCEKVTLQQTTPSVPKESYEQLPR